MNNQDPFAQSQHLARLWRDIADTAAGFRARGVDPRSAFGVLTSYAAGRRGGLEFLDVCRLVLDVLQTKYDREGRP